MNLAESITRQIEEEKIEPIAPWKFHVRYALFWVLFCIALIIGSVAFSLILYFLLEGDFALAHSPFMNLIETLPVVWVVSFVIFFVLGYWGLQHTPKGYKVPFWLFCGSNIVLTLGVGFGLYIADIPEQLDEHSRSLPFVQGLEEKQEKFWGRPEEGFLGGVVRQSSHDKIELIDFSGQVWTVELSESIQEQREKMEPLKKREGARAEEEREGDMLPPSPSQMLDGRKIKLRGEMVSDSVFLAEELMPWKKSHLKPCRRDDCRPPFMER